MSETRIKTSELWSEVQKVGEGRPEFVYEQDSSPGGRSCSYARDGQPSCIVGHALVRLGLSVGDLELFDELGDSGISEVVEASGHIFDEDDPEATRKATVAQNQQDHGKPWGEATQGALDSNREEWW